MFGVGGERTHPRMEEEEKEDKKKARRWCT
jgi:hypothetical protein